MAAATQILLLTRDPLVERRVARLADQLGAQALQVVTPPDEAGVPAPVGLLVELELDGALDTLRSWRAAHRELAIVAYLATPRPELWGQAEAAGADAVTTRGRADRELARAIEDRLSGRHASRRLRLAPYKDFAGRLGYVGRIDETPVGPITVYHVDNRIHAISDACPHAGASLAGGTLEGDVVTCPRHGSQFRVTTGKRVRGPADVGVVHFPVVVEAGEVFIELPVDVQA